MARVLFDRVSKRFGSVTAVKELSLEARDKEFLVLVGPSGCGKSTALRLLAGLEEVSEGRVFIGERDVTHEPSKDRNIAMVFQSYALYPHMSVYDNMAFSLSIRGTPKPQIRERVQDAARILEITGLLDRKPAQLSGGQRQRVALGRAIVREPQVFLLDEPLSNLDAKLRLQTRAELIKLHQRLETTAVYVTHDQVEAMTMGHRIAVMDQGMLQQLDTPQNLYNRPANLFVAGFLGSPPMNFFPLQLRQESARGLVGGGAGFELLIPQEVAGALGRFVDSEVVFGVRPDDVYLYYGEDNLPCQLPCLLTAMGEVVEFLGSDLIAYLTVGEASLVGQFKATEALQPGTQVEVVLDMGHAHFFDPATEAAIR